MNTDLDLLPAGPSWPQVEVGFDDYTAAEHIGMAHLGPIMTDAEAAGLVASWSFVRKSPVWRLRYLPRRRDAEQETRAFLSQSLDSLHAAGRIAQWTETIYEPETHRFGGPAGMDITHRLFHQDSRHFLGYLRNHTTGAGDKRRELSVLLCATLMRGAGQDWYEQGDIWARVAENRPPTADTPLDRVHGMETGLRRLMTVDSGPTSTLVSPNGSLDFLADWSAAFTSTGTALGQCAHDGTLRLGVRAVLTHHVIFHWNRIGLSYAMQSILSHAATAVVLGE